MVPPVMLYAVGFVVATFGRVFLVRYLPCCMTYNRTVCFFQVHELWQARPALEPLSLSSLRSTSKLGIRLPFRKRDDIVWRPLPYLLTHLSRQP